MAISDKIISFWKQVKLKSSDMFTLFKVGIGLKFPTHKLHVKDATDPIKVEGVQSDTSSSTKFLVLDGSDVVKHTTAGGKTTEEVQDIVGAMFTSNTETGIAATYEDSDGTIDLVVSGVTDLHTAGVDGAANQLLTDDGDGTVTSESHLTFASSTLELGGDTFDSFKIQRKDHSDNIGGELRIFSGAGGGTNKAGGDLIFKSGKGTGNALGGAIEFYVSTAGSSGDTAHFLQAIDMKITDGLVHVTGNITLTGTVDGIDIATDVAANTAKTGITTGQANAITANTAKVDLTVNGAGTIHSNNVPTLNQSTTGNATTATVASTSAITDAAAASTTYYPVLVDGFTGFQALEAESELTFVGNTGILTATGFAGALTGDVTGNVSGTAATVTGGTQASITTCANLVTVGTITTGTWNGGVIASAYLDSDTAHLSGTQTFSGTKTFSNTISGSIDGNSATSTLARNVEGLTDTDVTIKSDGDITITIDNDGDETNSLLLFKSRTVEIGRIDEVGNATFPGIITGKQREIYSQSFLDDLGTTKHYLPFKDINEQTTIYQEEAAMLMPCDGRIVSVTVKTASVTGSGNMTIGVNTIAPNVNIFSTGNWTEEETESLAVSSADDYHVFHFAFDNAKHFDSGDLVTISIQNDADLSGTTYWYVTTVVEYDWNTYLGTTSAEYDSNP